MKLAKRLILTLPLLTWQACGEKQTGFNEQSTANFFRVLILMPREVMPSLTSQLLKMPMLTRF